MSTAGGASIPPEQLKARYIGTGHADMQKQVQLLKLLTQARKKGACYRYHDATCKFVNFIE